MRGYRSKTRTGMNSQWEISHEAQEQNYSSIHISRLYGFPEIACRQLALNRLCSAYLKCHYLAALPRSAHNTHGFYSPASFHGCEAHRFKICQWM